jgi:hypothetical protein
MGWQPGEHVVRREVWNGRVWTASDAIVVRDEPEHLVIFTPTGAPMRYPEGDWPTVDGRHPWHDKPSWRGHGCLQVLEPGEDYSVWVFWNGPDRAFDCWYVNLQAPFVRTDLGIDTLDREVDVVLKQDGTVALKDIDAIADCVRYGRFDETFAQQVVERGKSLAERLRTEGIWWEPSWSTWTPPDDWKPLDELPPGWEVLGMRDASTFGDVRS